MRFRNGVVAVAGFLVLAANGLSQVGAVEGDVKGTDGKPIVNATVQILRLDVNRTYDVKTDKKGSYYYRGLPFGFYAIKVQVDGKDVAGITGLKAQLGAPLLVNFDLRISLQEQENRVKAELKKLGAEWSMVKSMQIQSDPSTTPQKK